MAETQGTGTPTRTIQLHREPKTPDAAIVAHSTTHQEDHVQRMEQGVQAVASLATGSLFVVPAQKTRTGQVQPRDSQYKQQQGIHTLDTTDPDTEFPTAPSSASHMQDTPQLYFHSLYIDSVSKTDTQALVQIGVDVGQGTTPLLCKIDTGAEGNVIPVNTYK